MGLSLGNFQLTNQATVQMDKTGNGNHRKYDDVITNWTCESASGYLEGGSQRVVRCYFQVQNGTQTYDASTINNNDPATGQWNASRFPTLPGDTYYNLYAQADDDPPGSPSGEVQGIYCA
jgi:hypothetical protein